MSFRLRGRLQEDNSPPILCRLYWSLLPLSLSPCHLWVSLLRVLSRFRSGLDQRQKLLPGFGVIPEDAQHTAGDGFAVHLLNAPHHHAHVAVTQRYREWCRWWNVMGQSMLRGVLLEVTVLSFMQMMIFAYPRMRVGSQGARGERKWAFFLIHTRVLIQKYLSTHSDVFFFLSSINPWCHL